MSHQLKRSKDCADYGFLFARSPDAGLLFGEPRSGTKDVLVLVFIASD